MPYKLANTQFYKTSMFFYNSIVYLFLSSVLILHVLDIVFIHMVYFQMLERWLACERTGFDPRSRQTYVVKIDDSDSSTGNRCECHGSWGMTIKNPCLSSRGTLKNPHCSMAMSVEYRSTFEAFLR